MPKVSSITRVLEIIEAVSYAPKPITPLELSQELDIPKPTIHRLIQNLVEEGFARGYVPHARAGKLREHVVRIVGKRVRFSGHEATECVRAGDVEGDVRAVRFEDSFDFGVRTRACDAYVGHRRGEVHGHPAFCRCERIYSSAHAHGI